MQLLKTRITSQRALRVRGIVHLPNVLDNKNDKRFVYSIELLYKCIKECNELSKDAVVTIAGSHWKLIDVFGGNWSIETYRKKFIKYEHVRPFLKCF